MNRGGHRIAVVGVGPKGLFCLESLAIELSRSTSRVRPEIHLFEPHPYPGAGPVYDPRQPDYLLMNFANRNIDLWSRAPEKEAGVSASPLGGLTYVSWLETSPSFVGTDEDLWTPDSYSPRRWVGEYLHAGFRRVLEMLATNARVFLRRRRVDRIERVGDAWRLAYRTNEGECAVEADEVLLATGHDSRRSGSLFEGHPAMVPGVYPVADHLGPDRVPAGSTVAIRGLGLTAIDAILALTVGRGGRFEPVAERGEPWILRYVPSGNEPARILPFSRTGRPMHAKSARHPRELSDTLAVVYERGVAKLNAVHSAGGAVDRITTVLAATARRALAAARGERDVLGPSSFLGDPLERRLERMLERPSERYPYDASARVERMERQLEIAHGARRHDASWALAESWRGLYPGLVELVRRRALIADERTAFGRLCREMERIAFGPPPETAARLLALSRAGVVDWGVARGSRLEPRRDTFVVLGSDGCSRADRVVDAVLTPPGVGDRPSPLLLSLLGGGHARMQSGVDGIEVDEEGRCVGSTGVATPGISLIGRATEGSVLGNDTLSRTLHPHAELWARRVAHRLPAAELAG